MVGSVWQDMAWCACICVCVYGTPSLVHTAWHTLHTWCLLRPGLYCTNTAQTVVLHAILIGVLCSRFLHSSHVLPTQ